MSKRNLLTMMLVLVGTLGVVLACGGTSTATNGGNSSSTPPATHYKVGQQAKLGNTFALTVNSFKTNPGDEFTMPKSGDKFVVVDVSIKNTSSQKQDISSALNFTLQDTTGQKYDETIVPNATPPDGSVPAGSLLRGQLAYEVPTSQHKFTFTFDFDLTGDNTLVWDLTN